MCLSNLSDTGPNAPITAGTTVTFFSFHNFLISSLRSWYFSIFSSSLSFTRASPGIAKSNLVPRSHSVTGSVRSGKVRQYTIFHWLLKNGCGNAIYAPIGLFRGALSEGLVFASSCAFLNKCQLCGGKFCFFRRPKSFTVEENHFKKLRRLCKWYRRKPHLPCHSNKVLRSLLRGTQKLINSS